jgi:hypothetical protein
LVLQRRRIRRRFAFVKPSPKTSPRQIFGGQTDKIALTSVLMSNDS